MPGGPIGGAQASNANFEIGEDVVSPVLWSRNIRRLDAVALTHAHSDHMGGMPSVFKIFVRGRFGWAVTRAFRLTRRSWPRPPTNVPVESMAGGDHFAFGGAQVEVLAPPVGYTPGPARQQRRFSGAPCRLRANLGPARRRSQAASESDVLAETLTPIC